MFKSLGLQVRRDDRTHQQFMDHWLNVHAPISRGVEGLQGYVLNEVVRTGRDVDAPQTQPDFGAIVDGIAQLWFATRDGLARMAEAPAVQTWFADGPNYVGLRTGFLTEETVVRSPGEGAARAGWKTVCFVDGEAQGLDQALHGLPIQGVVLSRIEAVTGSTNLSAFEAPPISAAVELWAGDADEAAAHADGLAACLPAGVRLVSVLLVREIVVKQPPH